MATDVKNANGDADMAECEGEKVVTMMDVLKEQEDFEEDANAVLGGSDDKNCTFSKGYIKRQAIYACLTCCSDAKTDPDKRAGVCLACSLMCHENHELIELYTKRNFRCDCGSPKFNSHPCTFTPIKTELNEDNNYNQNFSGLYCTCKRPYPDPEATEEDVMIQCIICEDWLHSSHLGSNVPANEQYSEMVCKQCMDNNDFLHDYSEFTVNTECIVEIVQVNGNDGHPVIFNGNANENELTNSTNDKENIDFNKTTTKQDVFSSKDDDALKEDASEESVKEENDQKEELNTTCSENLQNSSSDENREKDQNTVADIKKCNLEEATPLKKSNPSEEIEKVATTNEISEKKINEENIEMCNIDSDKTDVKEANESKIEINTQITASSDDMNMTGGKKNESDQSKPELAVASDQELKIPEIMEEKEEQDAEKMEEDRLLADPIEEPESKSSPLNDKETMNTETIAKDEKSSEINEKSEISEKNTEENQNMQTENKTDMFVEKMEPMESANSETTAINKISKDVQEDSSIKEKSSEKRKLSIEISADNQDIKKPKLDTQNKLCSRPQDVKRVHKGATFWLSSFRQKLCTCQECISMYRDLSVLFLTDPEDTVTAYENLGKDIINGKPLTQYEKGLEALSSLDRIQQINALTEYNNMRDKLLDFLKSFKDRKEIVKEEDIKAFFAGMKPKREPDGVYFCR